MLALAIVRQRSDEDFFRRSAEASTSPPAKLVLTEIADSMGECRRQLEGRKALLIQALGVVDGDKAKGSS
jgi:hypothetical protein